jgi:DNA-binding transcriptional LysR family regulator
MLDARGAESFVAVAAARSFSGAARTLGVTVSAVSQSVRAFEAKLGVPLLVRTTRSVQLTEAGARLLERLAPVLDAAEAALDEARGAANVVQGTLRITLGGLTVPLVLEPVLAPLLAAHPYLSIEISVDNGFIDIVDAGFDAGVRLSEAIEPDLVAVRLTPPFRLLVAGAPSYFATRMKPKVPRDLLDHDCIGYREVNTGTIYNWELAKRRRGKIEQAIAIRGRVVCNDGPTMIAAALRGVGLVYMHEPAIADHVKRGELVTVLEDFALTVPGFFLYFARKSSQQPKLRAFLEVARRVLKR